MVFQVVEDVTCERVGSIIEPGNSPLNGNESPEELCHRVIKGLLVKVGARQLGITLPTEEVLIHLQPTIAHDTGTWRYQVKQTRPDTRLHSPHQGIV